MNYKQTLSMASLAVRIDKPIFVFGPAGNGKTDIPRELTRLAKLNLTAPTLLPYYINLSQSELITFMGLPDLSEGVTTFKQPLLFKEINALTSAHPNALVLVTIDEVGHQGMDNLDGVLYQLIDQKKVGEHTFAHPHNIRFLLLGNLPKHGSGMDSPPNPIMLNRAMVVDMDGLTYQEWAKWGARNDIHPLMLAFNEHTRGQHLNTFKRENLVNSTPRSLNIASLILHEMIPVSTLTDPRTANLWEHDMVVEALSCAVGAKTANEMAIVLEHFSAFPPLETIYKSTEKKPAPSPTSRIGAMLVTHLLASQTADEDTPTPVIVDYMRQVAKEYGDELLSIYISTLANAEVLPALVHSDGDYILPLMTEFGVAVSEVS